MDARVAEVDGREMDHLEICHHGSDLDGFMDEVRVGIWDIDQVPLKHPDIQQVRL
jgi:hypothetical protein